MIRVAAIVEGYGDVDALPSLIARTGHLLGEEYAAPKPIRAGEWKSLKVGKKLEGFLDLAASRTFEKILVFLDLEDDCAKAQSEAARTRIESWAGNRDIDTVVSFAVREYETMFLHCLDDVSGASRSDVPAPDEIRGAKEALRPFIGRRYKETQDQAAFTKQINLKALYGRSRSYRNFCKALSGLPYDTLDRLFAT